MVEKKSEPVREMHRVPGEIFVVGGVGFPVNAVTQKFAFLGRSESGKTYGAGKFAEELLEFRAQTVIMDNIGNWWGLRMDASGNEKKGFKIPIIGGEHGDIPIESTGGKIVAEFVVDTRASVIIDISEFTGGEMRRFVEDFATHLLHLKKKKKSPVMVIWEECQDVVPQKAMHDSARMLGAMEKLIKQGRNYGIGTTLISQRPQAVNKEVLNQTECMMCFQITAPHDKKAIYEWMHDHSVDLDLFDELPKLAKGECFIWSPSWLRIFQKGKVLKKKTFDSSATPEFGQTIENKDLAPIDLEVLSDKMKLAVEKVKENNPVLLKKKIQELTHELEQERKKKQAPPPKPEIKVVQHEIDRKQLKADVVKAIDDFFNELPKPDNRFAGVPINKIGTIIGSLEEMSESISSPPNESRKNLNAVVREELQSMDRTAKNRTNEAPRNSTAMDVTIDKPGRAILTVLSTYKHTTLSKNAIGILSGYSPGSGGFNNAISKLRTAGYIIGGANNLTPTDAGLEALGPVESLPTGIALHEFWYNKLPTCEAKILKVLIGRYPQRLDKFSIGAEAEYSYTSGGFNNALSRLRTIGLIEGSHGEYIKAVDSLFI